VTIVVLWPATGLGPVDQDPDQVREDACDLLSPATACHPPDTELRVPDAPTSGGGVGFGPLAWLILIVAVAALVGLIVRAIANRVRDRDGDDADDEDGAVDTVTPLESVQLDHANPPGDWRARSQRHRAAGELRDALRCEYRALVGDLARRRLLDEIPGRTTGEERAQLRRTTPTVTAPFAAAADLFDAVWYGAADATAEMLERFDALEAEVLAATAGVRRPAEPAGMAGG